jgi:sugar phosphate isomerase/epimerase
MNHSLRFSCADFSFPLLPHKEALRLIRMLGIEAVDLGLFSGRSHLQPEQILSNPSAAGRQLKKRLDEKELELSDVFVQLGCEPGDRAVNDPDLRIRQENRDRFRATVEFAHSMECLHMTGLPGVWIQGQSPEDGLQLATEETAWRLAAAQEAGMTYAVEPHVSSNCATPEAALTFLKQVPGLTLTLDHGHFVYQGRHTSDADVLLPQASHFHARCGAKGRLQARFPHNQIDFRCMVQHCLAVQNPPRICLEYVWVDWEGCNEVDNLSETILLKRHLQDLAGECTS